MKKKFKNKDWEELGHALKSKRLRRLDQDTKYEHRPIQTRSNEHLMRCYMCDREFLTEDIEFPDFFELCPSCRVIDLSCVASEAHLIFLCEEVNGSGYAWFRDLSQRYLRLHVHQVYGMFCDSFDIANLPNVCNRDCNASECRVLEHRKYTEAPNIAQLDSGCGDLSYYGDVRDYCLKQRDIRCCSPSVFFVYVAFIKVPTGLFLKLGASGTPWSREKSLFKGIPYCFEILLLIPFPSKSEANRFEFQVKLRLKSQFSFAVVPREIFQDYMRVKSEVYFLQYYQHIQSVIGELAPRL